MRHFVFNGDADGLCALQQMRLGRTDPVNLITGVKRDVDLVRRVRAAPEDEVTVLDVALTGNRDSVLALLAAGARVRYFDHHEPGELLSHSGLELHIRTSPEQCTSLIVHEHLGGRWPLWAAVGAFGDNLGAPAAKLTSDAGLTIEESDRLRDLGIGLNYNAYGESEADLLIAPAMLHARLIRHEDPLEFTREDPLFEQLRERYRADLEAADGIRAAALTETAAVFVLPDSAWSRRVSGTWAHDLANENPNRAHAVLTSNSRGGYTVSVRAAKSKPRGAAAFCRELGGGGREAAAGINHLPAGDLSEFCAKFLERFTSRR